MVPVADGGDAAVSTTRTEDAMRWGRPSLVEQLRAERDHARALACRLEEELAQHRCHVCAGVREHVLGCPEMDRPR